MVRSPSHLPLAVDPAPRGMRDRDAGYLAFVGLQLVGVAISTLLMSWGLFVLFFLAIAGFSLEGFMHQLANLASRYVAADADRIAHFNMVLLIAHSLLSLAILILRRHRIMPGPSAHRRQVHG